MQEVRKLAKPAESTLPNQVKVTFTPHLIPMTRGILSTCYAPLVPGQPADVRRIAPAGP